jgi:signal transduction histidine kinase
MQPALLNLASSQGSPAAGLLPILAAIGGLFVLALGFIALLLFSQRRLVEAARARSEAQKRLLEAAAAGNLVLWTADATAKALEIGGSAETLFGVRPESLEGLLDLVQEGPAVRALLEDVVHTERPPQVFRMRHRTGRMLETQWQVRHREGHLEGVIRDITRESQLQAQLIQSQKLEAVGTLVSGVSHEFGNLLATVDACVGLLVPSGRLSPDEAEAARHIQDAALRGKDLIRQLMTFTRRGLGEVRPEPPQLLLEELQRLLGPLFGRRIQVEVEADPALPPHPMNRAQILQALLNLCLNARDAMPNGGRIRLRARSESEALILEVEDQGPGILPELRARIFEPFFTTKEAGKGTGLGLAMTLSIVQAHGGTIACDQGEGGGALFRMVFPPGPFPGIGRQIGG